MATPIFPPKDIEVNATGAVAVYSLADKGSAKRQYSEASSGHDLRDYRAGDPLGKSLGEIVASATGDVFVKVETYRWVSDGIFGHARNWAISYLLLSDENKTWKRSTDYNPLVEQVADEVKFREILRSTFLTPWGVIEPTTVTYRLDTTDNRLKWFLKWPNGYEVSFEAFSGLAAQVRIDNVNRSVTPPPDPDAPPPPAPDPTPIPSMPVVPPVVAPPKKSWLETYWWAIAVPVGVGLVFLLLTLTKKTDKVPPATGQ